MAQFTRISIISGLEHTMEIPITQAEWEDFAGARRTKGGLMIQDAFPQLTPDQREFLISGITAEEWEQEFGEDDEGEDSVEG